MANPITRRKFLTRCSKQAIACAGAAMLPWAIDGRPAKAALLKQGLIKRKLSPYYIPLDNKTVRCNLCPHTCEVEPGERGFCEVRENIDGKYYSLVYANPCAVHIDPIEKKPFYHILPGSRSFSLATAGCNFDCKFCQNWEISQAKPDETYNYELQPKVVVENALLYNCASIASTYVEPVIFMEYMLEIGKIAKTKPLLKVMHSNGFVNPDPLNDLCEVLDAACIDLKGFTEVYYQDMTEGRLEPVLNTLKILKARLYDIKLKEQDEEKQRLEKEKKDIAWGSQIRSYVLHPYQMIKDHRTNMETGKVDDFLDGGINEFIESFLRYQDPGEVNSLK